LFGTTDEPTALAAKIRGVKSNTFEVGTAGGAAAKDKGIRTKLSESEKKKVAEMLKNAKTIQEISRIEKDLAEGRVPRGAADADRMES